MKVTNIQDHSAGTFHAEGWIPQSRPQGAGGLPREGQTPETPGHMQFLEHVPPGPGIRLDRPCTVLPAGA